MRRTSILSEMLVTINTLGGIVPYCRAILRATTNIVKFAIVVCGDGMKLKLCIADRQINALMKAADLCPDYKVFVTIVEEEIKRKGIDPDETFIRRLIELSKSEKKYWIPAIIHEGLIYAAEGIKEISDGEKIMFIDRGVTA